MPILVVNSNDTLVSPEGEVTLAAGASMSMRLWRDEEPHAKQPHRSPYETIGYVISGKAELMIEGQTALLTPGCSWLVPANAEHTYRVIETFSAVECNTPPQRRPIDFSHGSGVTMPRA